MEIPTSKEQIPKQGKLEMQVDLEVTAYYKPLPKPKQKKFISGSYDREIKLNGSGVTSTGEPVKIGHAAADPVVFPFGSILEVPGHGKVVVEDTGSQIKGKRLDIFVGVGDQGRKKAMSWGRKIICVRVLRLGKPA
ncbi:3D domain-containing protein [Candidatus Wolfebacteria bacterium]|nr:3D domain-containing protein [Candidatus Wolfebacteria bacterium]